MKNRPTDPLNELIKKQHANLILESVCIIAIAILAVVALLCSATFLFHVI